MKHLEEIINGEQFSELHVLDMFCLQYSNDSRIDCEIGVDGANYLKDMMISKPLILLQELNLSGM